MLMPSPRFFAVLATAVALGALDLTAQPSRMMAPLPSNDLVRSAGMFDWLFGGSQQAPSPSQSRPPHDEEGTPRNELERPSRKQSGTYRTMCVRLCDGFYFPISFSATRNRFEEDANRCERQCPSRSRLYVYRNPGENLEHMVDLKDEPYAQLPTAFRFQTTYDPKCTCRGNPWNPEEIARHSAYPPVQFPADAAIASIDKRRTPESRRGGQPQTWGYRAQREESD
jgi:hypothetical protein